jgi:hypothetical protein
MKGTRIKERERERNAPSLFEDLLLEVEALPVDLPRRGGEVDLGPDRRGQVRLAKFAQAALAPEPGMGTHTHPCD